MRTLNTKGGNKMGTEAIRLSELSKLGATEKDSKLRKLMGATRRPPNGELAALDGRIREYEARAGYDSGTLKRRLASGEIAETADVCDWLMLLDLRERVGSVISRPR
jgi:hypothetical protein